MALTSLRAHQPRKSRLPIFKTLVLLLSICIVTCVFSTARIYSQLDHHDQNAATKRGFRRPGEIEILSRHDDITRNRGHDKSDRGLSACLLINDENPRLPEWIAYHYHVLPLRHLIVAIDPASRSSPVEILRRWGEIELDFQIWTDDDFLPEEDKHGKNQRGKCDASDAKTDCLWHHRKRQRYFIKKCMADFKKRNMTWTLLTDVDEYITFNRIREDDPPVPLAMAPEGVPTLRDWKEKLYNLVDSKTNQVVQDVHIEGTVTGLRKEGFHSMKNGDHISTGVLVIENQDVYQGIHGAAYGNVVINESGDQYFLRDDFAFRDAVPMAHAPMTVPTLKDSSVNGSILHAKIYNDTYNGNKDGAWVEIPTNWREWSKITEEAKSLLGGHLMLAANRDTYYLERELALWPPHLSPEDAMAVRSRLPSVGDDERTILDVLESELQIFGNYAKETIGPCLSMPRLLYGSHENRNETSWENMAPDGFDDADFVTLRYRWHAVKEARANKFQKVIVDVSRLRMNDLGGEAENIHVPLKYYCRKYPPRYSVSYFRVNHYLDSFEAYSYRNDARSSKRHCRECYDEKGKEATAAMDNDIRPWLKSFVRSMGPEKAKKLLAGAGNFVQLS